MILIIKGISFVKVSGAAWLAQLGKCRSAEHEVRLNWKSTLAHATLHITLSSYNLVPALKDTANKCTCAWEFKKPFIFCFIILHSDKDKWTIWVEYAVGSLPCSKKFFSRYSGFPLSSKPTFTNANYTWIRDGRRRTTEWMCYLYRKSLLVINYLLVCQDSFYGNKFF